MLWVCDVESPEGFGTIDGGDILSDKDLGSLDLKGSTSELLGLTSAVLESNHALNATMSTGSSGSSSGSSTASSGSAVES